MRYHEIPAGAVDLIKARMDEKNVADFNGDQPVFSWNRDDKTDQSVRTEKFRAPVLPDLRSGDN